MRRQDDQGSADAGPEASPTKSLYTLTPIPLPPKPPPSGKLIADIEQSSRDGAANRFQVWIDNDTDSTITPTKVTYHDDRFQTPLPGTRLRDIPSQARRGFPIYRARPAGLRPHGRRAAPSPSSTPSTASRRARPCRSRTRPR